MLGVQSQGQRSDFGPPVFIGLKVTLVTHRATQPHKSNKLWKSKMKVDDSQVESWFIALQKGILSHFKSVN